MGAQGREGKGTKKRHLPPYSVLEEQMSQSLVGSGGSHQVSGTQGRLTAISISFCALPCFTYRRKDGADRHPPLTSFGPLQLHGANNSTNLDCPGFTADMAYIAVTRRKVRGDFHLIVFLSSPLYHARSWEVVDARTDYGQTDAPQF